MCVSAARCTSGKSVLLSRYLLCFTLIVAILFFFFSFFLCFVSLRSFSFYISCRIGGSGDDGEMRVFVNRCTLHTKKLVIAASTSEKTRQKMILIISFFAFISFPFHSVCSIWSSSTTTFTHVCGFSSNEGESSLALAIVSTFRNAFACGRIFRFRLFFPAFASLVWFFLLFFLFYFQFHFCSHQTWPIDDVDFDRTWAMCAFAYVCLPHGAAARSVKVKTENHNIQNDFESISYTVGVEGETDTSHLRALW